MEMNTYLPDFVENAGAMQRFDTLDVSAMLTLESALGGQRASRRVSPEAAPGTRDW